MCSRCHKNMAIIFVTRMDGNQHKNEGLCLQCAKELGIKPVEQLMSQMAIDEEQIESINKQLAEFMSGETDSEGDINDNPFAFVNKLFNNSQNSQGKGEENKTSLEDKSKKEKKNKILNNYGINLTEKAKEGKVDRIIGRNVEIERVIQILNRRTKNNPVLIGEAGVGKTAIAEGLATRIVEKSVPAKLLSYEVYLLDFTALVAGTQFRGQFEARLKNLINEVKESGNIILVIDELHNIIGAGEAEGAMNAANILKPALARGEIQVLGATTLAEYRKSIEKDSALERRFQSVIVDEPSVEDSIEILKGIKHYYEKYHNVIIPDNIIENAVILSERYITERFLPDKAIDVIDEASSRANLRNIHLCELEKYRAELREIQKEKEMSVSLDTIEDYQKAADLKTNECRVLTKIKEIEQNSDVVNITYNDIAHVIEAWTKIPVQRITELESEKLIDLENRIHKRIISQDEAVSAFAKAIRRNRAGIKRKKKPISFIFVGPTGVGKTELVKVIAEELFDTEEALIRLDMSEYMEKHSVSKIIGAPPGYVGYDDAGQLTEKVRRKPYSVILLDEIEKAHVDVFNILLQILDDGKIADSHGKMISFENTIIVMTSNAGTQFKGGSYGFSNNKELSDSIKNKEALKEFFKPEFINRVDEIISFKQLEKDDLYNIIKLLLDELKEDLKEKSINLKFNDNVTDFIYEKGYDKKYGARPLKRAIQKNIEDILADAIIRGDIKESDNILVYIENDKTKIKLL
jgi:ATP-dependent Clp protease ATP-binding subunit ClpE